MQFQQVEAVIDREIMAGIAQVESVEARLGFFQCNFHFTGLQDLVGMIGRETEGHAAVHDILTQAERQVYDAFFRSLISDGVVVERTCHTRHGRIIAVAVLVAHHFLQDDSHLFLVDDIACGLHIGFGVAEIYRGVNSFDCITEHAEHFILIVQVGNHISIVDPGERLVVRIFQ